MSATAHNTDTHDHGGSTPKTIWKTFWILLAITIGEIIYALTIAHKCPKLMNNSLYAVLSFMKAGYIISEFMHMKYEVKNLVRTVGLPCLLLTWLILAFIMDGTSWKKMMNKPMPMGAETTQHEAVEHH
jgi:cytochrome c oxidase subunit 4